VEAIQKKIETKVDTTTSTGQEETEAYHEKIRAKVDTAMNASKEVMEMIQEKTEDNKEKMEANQENI
jgi:hypothetical protein